MWRVCGRHAGTPAGLTRRCGIGVGTPPGSLLMRGGARGAPRTRTPRPRSRNASRPSFARFHRPFPLSLSWSRSEPGHVAALVGRDAAKGGLLEQGLRPGKAMAPKQVGGLDQAVCPIGASRRDWVNGKTTVSMPPLASADHAVVKLCPDPGGSHSVRIGYFTSLFRQRPPTGPFERVECQPNEIPAVNTHRFYAQ